MVPLAPLADFSAIETAAIAGHLRHLPPSIAVWQSITSRVRHAHTDYDALLAEGYDQESARHFLLGEMNSKLAEWGCSQQIEMDEN